MIDSPRSLNIGVVGLGMMGQTHLDAYAKIPHAKVLAVADLDAQRLSGQSTAAGNIEGQAQGGFDLASPDIRKYQDGHELIADADLDIIDVCVPTPGHLAMGLAALRAGKHTLIEKPLARTYEQAVQLADAAEEAWREHRAVSMCAMCMRFWPGWDWLKNTIDAQAYGPVRAATFRRVASFPGGPFYSDGQASGGALLDLHIHDADFIRHAFAPETDPDTIQVTAQGYTQITGEPDHVFASYRFPADTPGLANDAIVTAEGSWAMAEGFGFSMRYTVNFEHATADFDLARGDHSVHLHRDGQTTEVDLPGAGSMGYDHELAYFLEQVRLGEQADRVTLRDAAESLKLIQQELAAITSNR
ncbi:MAG: Gfo/Idh/MocA family oxidoreductase [Planctomycetota bacterium]